MPCRDYETDSSYLEADNRDLKKRLDKVTELLCYTLGSLNNDAWFNGVSFRYYQERDPFDDLEVELMDWWTEHQKLDAEEKARLEVEAAEEERKKEILDRFNEMFTEEEQWDLRNIL